MRVIIIPPWTSCSYEPSVSGINSGCMLLHLQTDWLKKVVPALPEEKYCSEDLHFGAQCAQLTTSKLSYETTCAYLERNAGTDIGETCSEEIIVAAHKALQSSKYVEIPSNLPTATDFRIRRAYSYLEDNLGHEFTYSDIASQSGISRPHFFKRFKQQAGMTPRVFYNALRLEKSYYLIADGTLTLQEIALELGFSAQSNFSRFFRNHQGLSPDQYRDVLRVAFKPTETL